MNTSPRYDIGRTVLKDIWVDPVHGDDTADGLTRATAAATLEAAWARIPLSLSRAGHGYRIMVCPGTVRCLEGDHVDLRDRRGSADRPVVIQSADEALSAELPALHISRCGFLYLMDVKVSAEGRADRGTVHNHVMHIEECEDILIRNVTGTGIDTGPGYPMIVIKVNQTLRMYIEECDLSGAAENTIDYVAVNYGHIVRNRLHNARAEGMYVKGGSAYHLIAGNEVFGSCNHGILAGQCTGFQYLLEPWLHYEAYDIKVVNNVIHDAGSGLAVCGGYNILLAWNTCCRVGSNRDTIVVGLGGRGWDEPHIGDRRALLQAHYAAGGWCGPDEGCGFNIPNRNVQICNNIVYNPDGFESKYAHFGISGPVIPPAGSAIPSPARADDNLSIRGNIIWNGGPDKPLLDDVENEYHLAAKPTIDPQPLLDHNHINTLKPELADPDHGDFRPAPKGNVYKVKPVAIPDFTWDDAPARPPVPPGNPDTRVLRDRDGKRRGRNGAVGAYA